MLSIIMNSILPHKTGADPGILVRCVCVWIFFLLIGMVMGATLRPPVGPGQRPG